MSSDAQPPNPPAQQQPNVLGMLAGGAGALVGIVVGRYAGVMLLFPALFAGLTGWLLNKAVSHQKQPMVLAAAVLAGHALWMVLGMILLGTWTPALVDVILLLGGACWLAFAPSLIAVSLVSALQLIGLFLNTSEFLKATPNTDIHKALLVHILLRLVSLLFMGIGLNEYWKRCAAESPATTSDPLANPEHPV